MEVQFRSCVSSVGPECVYVRLKGIVTEKTVIFIDRERGSLLLTAFINQLMHLIDTVVDVKICVV